jgi:sulfite exporter TauE/SafE
MTGIAIFVFGLASSVHCLAMCGGIFFASQARGSRVLYYNAGRLLSYAAAGAVAGAIGSLASVSDGLRAAVSIVGGFLVAAIGCTMLGFFPALRRLSPSLPKSILGRLLGRFGGMVDGWGSFVAGLFTVLLPCAPLQTMLLLAMGRGTALKGAAAMLAFVAGTLPALIGAGTAYSKLASNARLSRHVARAAAVLVIAMGLGMAFRGLALAGVPARVASFFSVDAQLSRELPADAAIARTDAGERIAVQRVSTDIESMAFHPIVVQRGVPVAWTIRARPESLNEHSSTFSIPDLGIKKTLQPGDNLVEFSPPDRAGEMEYCSWCAMISSRIFVVDDLNTIRADIGNRVARSEKDVAR